MKENPDYNVIQFKKKKSEQSRNFSMDCLCIFGLLIIIAIIIAIIIGKIAIFPL